LVLAAGVASLATIAWASDQVAYAPPEPWVQPLPIPSADAVPDSGAAQTLLVDDQSHFDADGDVYYVERAIRLRTAQALGGANFIWDWNPETETLTVHKLHIIRDGQVIDVLASGKKLTVLRRETKLEAATLDGTLTATIQPEDVRVGDILDYAISIRRKDPLRRGFSEGFYAIDHPGVAGRFHIRASWPSSKPMRWRATEGLEAPPQRSKDGQVELVVDREQATAPKKPAGAPGRYQQIGELEISQYRDWAELSGIMAPLYRKAATLDAESPLKGEVAKIRSQYADPKQRAFAALKLVEDQTRYVFLGMNLGGYLPANADETWKRRFGDCKGKTALLLALLHELGIEAEPAFVNTEAGDGLDRRLPMLNLFDHVLVRAQINGATYWLDGTRAGDRNLEDIPAPSFRWALPLRDSGGQLVAIPQKPFAEPQTEKIARLEIQAGLEAPAVVHVEHLFRGDAAIGARLLIENVGKTDLDRYLRNYWSEDYPWVTAKAVGATYDEKTGLERFWIDGSGPLQWTISGNYRDFEVIDSEFGDDPDYHREDGPNKDAPFAVDFPNYEKRTTTVVLPQKGAGFTLWQPATLDTVIAGVSYKRTAELKDGVLVVQSEERSLAPDFPATETEKAAAALRKLAYDNVFLRALAPTSPASASASVQVPEPTDPVEFAVRGAKALNSNDYDAAIKDFTNAIRLDPKSAKYVYDRGVAHFQKGEDELALSDFNASLKLAPSDSLALAARAELELYKGKEDLARRDFDEALKGATDQKAVLRRRADVYRDTGFLPQAAGYYVEWLKAYPADKTVEEVKAELCRVSAQIGRSPPSAALEACEAVLKARPTSAAAQEGKAWSLLRQAKLTEAISAFDAVLSVDPDAVGALYGRGLARIRSGSASVGQADIKAASARDNGIAQRFKAYGLAP
jgi:tetratricopeptide (TPR) repeat protein